MKTYTIHLSTDTSDNQVDISTGVTTDTFTTNKGYTIHGIDLGYFAPRDTDISGTPLNRKCFAVKGVKDDTTPLTDICLTEPNERGNFVGMMKSDEDADHCLAYLDAKDANISGRWSNAKDLKIRHQLVEGRWFVDNVVPEKTTEKHSIRFACPSVIILNTNTDTTFVYFDKHTHHSRTVTIRWTGSELELVSNEPTPDRPRGPRREFGQRVRSAPVVHPDVLLPMEDAPERRRRDRRDNDRRHQRYEN